MASAAMRLLVDGQAKPEVRAEAAKALGLMPISSAVPKYNYDLVAHSIGWLAADLGAEIGTLVPSPRSGRLRPSPRPRRARRNAVRQSELPSRLTERPGRPSCTRQSSQGQVLDGTAGRSGVSGLRRRTRRPRCLGCSMPRRGQNAAYPRTSSSWSRRSPRRPST